MLHFLEQFNHFFVSFCVFPLILCLGVLFTWKLRCIQLSGIKTGFNLMMDRQTNEKDGECGKVSRYEAIAGFLAGNFGTGNIAGMAIGLACGGPGSLVWIWVAAFLGAVVQYAGSFLGVKYRRPLGKQGEYIGGPIACLAYGMNQRVLAGLFCIFTIVSAFVAGNCVQVSCVAPLCSDLALVKIFVGIAIALAVIPILAGGNNRILRFSAAVIPFIAGFYMLFCIVILFRNCSEIIPALRMIVDSAFGTKAVVSGLGGYTFSQVLSTGMSRAIMATDCGNGMVSILQSNSKSENPVMDGLVTLLPPFIVVSVCSITMLVLLVSGAYASGKEGALMVLYAFSSSLGSSGNIVVLLAMILFGYTTILTWFACAEKSLEYMIPGRQANFWLKASYVAVIPFGGVMDMRLAWMISDLAFAGMVLLNLITLMAFFKDVVATKCELAALKQGHLEMRRSE